MRTALLATFVTLAGYFLWSCKVRLAEQSTVAASETELAKMRGVDCSPTGNGYPRLSDVSVDPDHAALRFTLEDKAETGSVFKFRYFTHATKYYDPSQNTQYYAVRLGHNLLDFAASDTIVQKIFYKGKSNPIELSCN